MRILIISLSAILISNFYGFSQSYVEELRSKRVLHMAELLDTSKHILTADEAAYFQGVAYFEIDTSYILNAHFKLDRGKWFEMPTTTARKPIYRRYGFVEFELNGILHHLTVYQNKALRKKPGLEDYLFIPFNDLTNGKESYGGGRYLDFRIPENLSVALDFNLAYNPYCAYADRYSCPIPPVENKLLIEIRVGEKVPVGKNK
jgi:uncharacterized protein (DUF1684 family)